MAASAATVCVLSIVVYNGHQSHRALVAIFENEQKLMEYAAANELSTACSDWEQFLVPHYTKKLYTLNQVHAFPLSDGERLPATEKEIGQGLSGKPRNKYTGASKAAEPDPSSRRTASSAHALLILYF